MQDEKEILKNLLEKYDYEFSQWDKRDVNKLGLYGYDYLDCYWTDKNRWAYFILAADKLAGFAMVNDYSEGNEKTDYTMSEFSVLYKYRKMGVGRQAAFSVFDKFHGSWQIKMHPRNIVSIKFWNNVVSEYTAENYRFIKACDGTSCLDGSPGDIILFKN